MKLRIVWYPFELQGILDFDQLFNQLLCLN